MRKTGTTQDKQKTCPGSKMRIGRNSYKVQLKLHMNFWPRLCIGGRNVVAVWDGWLRDDVWYVPPLLTTWITFTYRGTSSRSSLPPHHTHLFINRCETRMHHLLKPSSWSGFLSLLFCLGEMGPRLFRLPPVTWCHVLRATPVDYNVVIGWYSHVCACVVQLVNW